MKKRLLKFIFPLIIITGFLLISERSQGQLIAGEDFERANILSGTIPVDWGSTQGVAGFTTTTTSPINGTSSLTFNRPTSGTTTPVLSALLGGSAFSFNGSAPPYEWTFVYQAPASVTPADQTAGAVSGNDWRFFFNANGTDPTVNGFKGYYVTQNGNSIEFYYLCTGCGGRSKVGSSYTVTAGSKYIIRGVRQSNSGGTYLFYVAPYVNSTSFPTSAVNSAEFDQVGSYKNSFFQASVSSGNDGIFKWDDLNFFQASIVLTALNNVGTAPGGNGIAAFLTQNDSQKAVFGFTATALGTVTMTDCNFSWTTTGSGNSTYFTNAQLYYSSADDVYTHGADDSSLGSVALNSGSAAITTLSETMTNTARNYFLVVDVKNYASSTSATASIGLTNVKITGNSPITIVAGLSGTSFTLPATPTTWSGATSTAWALAGNWNGGVPTTTGSAIVPTGLTRYPVLVADVTVGTLSLNNANIDLAGFNLNVGSSILSNGTSSITTTGNSSYLDMTGGSGDRSISGTGLTVTNLKVDLPLSTNTLNMYGPVAITNLLTPTTGIVSTGGNLTLKSTSALTAGVTAINTSNASIVGDVTAERYMPAGNRGYRILSSPVYNVTGSAPYANLKSYDLNYMKLNTLISGPSDAANGFVTSLTHSPSVFAYNETLPAPATNNISTNDYKGFTSTSEYIPIGNGILLFYRGNENLTKSGGTGNPFQGPNYPTPEFTTLKNVGAIATGTITVNRPVFPTGSNFYNVLNTAAGTPGPSITGSSATLSYTVTSLPGTDGFNMLGNPYPSTIDLEALAYPTDFSGLAGNTKATFYTLNPNNPNGFGTYTRTGTGATGTALNGGKRYVLSGEGFFVKAASTSAYFKFTEASKTTYPTAGNIPSVFSLKDKNPAVKIKLIQDNTFYNETLVTFSKDNKSTFTEDEDVAYLSAPTQQVFMYSTSDEGTSCIINRLPALENIKTIKLYAEGAISGLYTMEFSNANTIDSRYRIYLKDAFKKDSLDVTNNTTYSFNIDRTNSATYGANRFTLAVYKDNSDAYKLVSFTGNKQQGAMVLTWTVQNESDVYTFDLERSTDGGKTYTVIGTVQSASKGTYQVTDPQPVYGDNLYRLKQSDVNDAITYSDIVTLTYDMPQAAETTINVYPNPASNKINIDFTQTILNPLEVYVINSNGKQVIKSKFNAAQHIEQEVGNLTTGIYIVDVYDTASNKKISSLKFIKI